MVKTLEKALKAFQTPTKTSNPEIKGRKTSKNTHYKILILIETGLLESSESTTGNDSATTEVARSESPVS